MLTFVSCLAFGEVFGAYLGEFARNYVSTYAGLASVMIALVFLYFMAAIFVFGGDLNAAIMRARKARRGLAPPASITSSSVRNPVVGAFTSTAMLPGACSFFHILVWASGICPTGRLPTCRGRCAGRARIVGGGGLLEMREMRALNALLAHPDETRVEGQVETGGARAKHHHAAALDHEAGHREGLLAGMLEHRVDVLLAGDVPDRLAEFARLAP